MILVVWYGWWRRQCRRIGGPLWYIRKMSPTTSILWAPLDLCYPSYFKSILCSFPDDCQDFEFPVLLVPLYVRVASLFHIERVGPDQF
jgi:hypothetical protein